MSTSAFSSTGTLDAFAFLPAAGSGVPYDDYLKLHDAVLAIEGALLASPATYTPTWTNGSIGNGTLLGRYWQMKHLVRVDLQMTAGSTTTFGGGAAWTFSLPVPALDTNGQVLTGRILDSGVQFFLAAGVLVSTTTFSIYTNAAAGSVTSASPHIWKANDELRVSGWYFAA